jgi:hypothetical protein
LTVKVHRTASNYKANLTARQGQQANVKFQVLPDQRTIVQSNPLCSLTLLQLGRAYVMQGDNNKAANQNFLTL